ncbi:hypothetical protein PsAD2_04297 [Pseudovibrio axinellae]|uniref:Methyltransferase FkbM domain-containing protein n=1 Tax=Pseudovibrio axinellae TaxID=989403 RepID=A0A165T3E2_9HYPH|nr:hypothetical protein [Pseudovibrio axinellae]KZL05372.1 hypothetical protein PsAD2_04297 [Pseudovibrio axinellae]SER37009.1 hypothetical protein SAMN05421798_10917 [Pseudovibrio axinellae]
MGSRSEDEPKEQAGSPDGYEKFAQMTGVFCIAAKSTTEAVDSTLNLSSSKRYLMLKPTEQEELGRIKLKLLNLLGERSNYRVLQGPFSGLRLLRKQYWGGTDLTSKILGSYEKEVQEELVGFSKAGKKVLVNIGAADGYFAIGVLYSQLFERAVIYERAEGARENLLQGMELNSVKQNQFVLHGDATSDTLRHIGETAEIDPSHFLFLIDIEGGEYELIDRDFIAQFGAASLIVEIHTRSVMDKNDPDFDAVGIDLGKKYDEFEKLVIKHWKLKKIYRQNFRFTNLLPELKDFSDDERLLLLSENRSSCGEWWVMTPF